MRAAAVLALAAVAAARAPLPSAKDAAPPATTYYNGSLLAYAAELVAAGDAALMPAYSALVASANGAMGVGPFSVVYKYNASLYPFPMDPHSYASIAFYYWPCTMTPPGEKPRNITNCNATSGLPWQSWDGHISPFYESFDMPSWASLASAVETLGLGYYFSRNESYAERAATLLRTWFMTPSTVMQPNLDHGQFIPGVNTGRGTGIIDFSEYFGTGLLDAVVLLRASPSWTAADDDGMMAWAAQYLEWLLTSPVARQENATTNNHKAYYEAQLLQLMLFSGNSSAAAERAPLAGAVLDGQIAANGSLPLEEARTRSLHYVSFCLHAYLGLARGASLAGFDLWGYRTRTTGAGIDTAVSFLLPYSNGSLPWPYQNLDGPAWSWSELFDVYRAAAYAYPAEAETFIRAADTAVNATAVTDVRRLLWPWPAPTGV